MAAHPSMATTQSHSLSSTEAFGRPGDVLARLDAMDPEAPLVAFGQTPFWDEPLKSLFAAHTRRRILVGIHDLDYFSRVHSPLPGPRWQLIGRNDAAWRDPWIAAGEISALLGAEVWPSRPRLLEAGVQLDRMFSGRSAQGHMARATEGWGWRGIVENVPRPAVICDLPAASALPAIEELLQWGFAETERLLSEAEARHSARALGHELIGEARQFVQARPAASVADLYSELLRRMYQLLLGEIPANVEFIGTRDLLRFNRRTAGLPRFRFVSHFLDPRHAQASRAAYEEAAKETARSAPPDSGEGSLPFEVYVPGRGRGELRLQPDRLLIATEPPVEVRLKTPVQSVEQLAEVLEGAAGAELSLVGKALALPPMLNGEFVMTLMESGSAYMPRTQRMLAHMARAGVPVRVRPLLRLRLRSWDSLGECKGGLRLPEHLEQAFGVKTLSTAEFARGWRRAVRGQEKLIQRLRRVNTPCDLAELLGREEHEAWFRRLEQCRRAQQALLEVQRQADQLRHEALDMQIKEDETLLEVRQLENKRGTLSRELLRPLKRRLADAEAGVVAEDMRKLREEHARAEGLGRALLMALESKQAERKNWRKRRAALVARLRTLERCGKAGRARRVLATMERLAGRVRLRLARHAILAADSLPHADLRPAAWWFPALDPAGAWFARVRRSARARLEPLLNEEGPDAAVHQG